MTVCDYVLVVINWLWNFFTENLGTLVATFLAFLGAFYIFRLQGKRDKAKEEVAIKKYNLDVLEYFVSLSESAMLIWEKQLKNFQSYGNQLSQNPLIKPKIMRETSFNIQRLKEVKFDNLFHALKYINQNTENIWILSGHIDLINMYFEYSIDGAKKLNDLKVEYFKKINNHIIDLYKETNNFSNYTEEEQLELYNSNEVNILKRFIDDFKKINQEDLYHDSTINLFKEFSKELRKTQSENRTIIKIYEKIIDTLMCYQEVQSLSEQNSEYYTTKIEAETKEAFQYINNFTQDLKLHLLK